MHESRNKREGRYSKHGHSSSIRSWRKRGPKSRLIWNKHCLATERRASFKHGRGFDAALALNIRFGHPPKLGLIDSMTITRGTGAKYPAKKNAAQKGQFIEQKRWRRMISKRCLRCNAPPFHYGMGVRKFAQRVLDDMKMSQHPISVARPTSLTDDPNGTLKVVDADIPALRAKVMDAGAKVAIDNILNTSLMQKAATLTDEDIRDMTPEQMKRTYDQLAEEVYRTDPVKAAKLIYRKGSKDNQ